jgi:hypothetical protein
MKRLAAFAMTLAALPVLAAEVRQIAPTSHSLFPTPADAVAVAGAGAGDASALKPPPRGLPGPILVERQARIGPDGAIVLSCAGDDRRDFRRQPAGAGVAR